MANNWRLLKTREDIDEAIAYVFNNKESIEVLVWNESEKQASVSKIDIHTRCYSSKVIKALAWRPSEDEEKFKKFLAKLDGDYDAYVLEFSAQATPEQCRVIADDIRESLDRELPFGKADYFVFEIICKRVIVLVGNTMSFDIPVGTPIFGIPVGYITHIQKTTPSYAAHDHDAFAKLLKKQREKLEKRFFGADVAVHYCGYDATVTKRLIEFLGAEEDD